MVEQKETKIFELKCEICGKEIKSLSESQTKYNMRQHKLNHEVKNE